MVGEFSEKKHVEGIEVRGCEGEAGRKECTQSMQYVLVWRKATRVQKGRKKFCTSAANYTTLPFTVLPPHHVRSNLRVSRNSSDKARPTIALHNQ